MLQSQREGHLRAPKSDQELGPGFPCGWQEANHLNCHGCLLPFALAGTGSRARSQTHVLWHGSSMSLNSGLRACSFYKYSYMSEKNLCRQLTIRTGVTLSSCHDLESSTVFLNRTSHRIPWRHLRVTPGITGDRNPGSLTSQGLKGFQRKDCLSGQFLWSLC